MALHARHSVVASILAFLVFSVQRCDTEKVGAWGCSWDAGSHALALSFIRYGTGTWQWVFFVLVLPNFVLFCGIVVKIVEIEDVGNDESDSC